MYTELKGNNHFYPFGCSFILGKIYNLLNIGEKDGEYGLFLLFNLSFLPVISGIAKRPYERKYKGLSRLAQFFKLLLVWK